MWSKEKKEEREEVTDRPILKSDLEQFKLQLLGEIRTLIKDVIDQKPKKWLKSVEVKKLLGLSHGTLQTMRNAGTISFMKIGGTIYYEEGEIQAMFERHRVK